VFKRIPWNCGYSRQVYNPRLHGLVYIGMGTNIGTHGQRVRRFHLGLKKLSALPATNVVAVSSIYETPPWGVIKQDSFYNAVAAIQTSLSPIALLRSLKTIETQLGRKQRQRWGPREIDLDILLMGELRLNTEPLVVPHPELLNRQFVLVPLLEISPTAPFPGGKQLAKSNGNCVPAFSREATPEESSG